MKQESFFIVQDAILIYKKTNAVVDVESCLVFSVSVSAEELASDKFFNFACNKILEYTDSNTNLQSDCKDKNNAECKLIHLSLTKDSVITENGAYNEAYLASLRTFLKKFEEQEIFAFIEVQNFLLAEQSTVLGEQKNANTKKTGENFAEEFYYHLARRIKDCRSFIGFLLPVSIAKTCIEKLSVKHAHYVYFLQSTSTSKVDESIKSCAMHFSKR